MAEQLSSTEVCLSAHTLCAFPPISSYKLRKYLKKFFLVIIHMHPLSVPITSPLAEFVERDNFCQIAPFTPLSLPLGDSPSNPLSVDLGCR